MDFRFVCENPTFLPPYAVAGLPSSPEIVWKACGQWWNRQNRIMSLFLHANPDEEEGAEEMERKKSWEEKKEGRRDTCASLVHVGIIKEAI